MSIQVLLPVEFTIHKGKEAVYRSYDLTMLNARYGMLELDIRATKIGKRATYKQCEVFYYPNAAFHQLYEDLSPEEKEQAWENLPKHMLWDYARVVTFPIRDNDQNQKLYELIDCETGWVILRSFRSEVKEFARFLEKQAVVYDYEHKTITIGGYTITIKRIYEVKYG